MAATLVKRVMMKIVADDGDTEAKLDRITEKADELGRKHPDIKVRIDSAAASAKLAVLKREMKDTADAANKDHHFSLSGIMPAIGQMSMFQKVMLGANVATTFAEPLLAGVTVAAGGLASGLTAAGAGLGAFGLVAKGVYSQVSSQIQNYRADQLAAQEATSQATKTADLLKMRDALGGLTGGQRQFAQSIIGAQNDWQNFVTANTSGVASIFHQGMGLLPGLFRDLQGFLPGVEGALHTIIGDLGKGLQSSGFQSFLHSLQANAGPALIKLAGTIGHLFEGIGGIIKAFMPESQQMLGGLDNLMGRFAHWGQTLSSHSGFQSLMSMFKTETPLAVHTLGNLGGIIKTLVGDMTGLSGFGNSKMLLQIAEPFTALLRVLLQTNPDLVRVGLYLLAAASGGKKLASVFGGLSSGVTTVKDLASGVQNFSKGFGSAEAAAEDATGAWGTWGGKIQSVFSSAQSMVTGFAQKLGIMRAATEEETVAQGELDVAMDANPIGLIVIAIGALVVAFVELWKHSAAFRNFWKGLWADIKTEAVGAWHFIDNNLIHPLVSGIGDLVGFVKGHWKILATIIGTVLLGPVAGLVIFVATHWSEIKSLTMRLVDDVTGFFESLPGRIMGALRSLVSDLYQIGKNAVLGLIHGVESMGGALVGAAEHMGESFLSTVKGFFGIGSPSKVMRQHGIWIGQGLISGLDVTTPAVAASAARMSAAALGSTASGHGGLGAGGGAGGVTVEIHVPPGGAMLGPDFWTALGRGIRVKGGDPAILQRKVKFV